MLRYTCLWDCQSKDCASSSLSCVSPGQHYIGDGTCGDQNWDSDWDSDSFLDQKGNCAFSEH